MNEARRLAEGAAHFELRLQESQLSRLSQLLDELTRWNRAYSLTSITGRAEMVTKHVLDSLAAAPFLQGTTIADAGTGAGFPGLPLAIVAPERRFILIDSNQKKIRFVSHAMRELGLTNVEILHARVESLRCAQLPVDTIVTRAFAPLERMLQSLSSLSGPRTRVLAMKGHVSDAELAAVAPDWHIERTQPVVVPGLDEARAIVIATRA